MPLFLRLMVMLAITTRCMFSAAAEPLTILSSGLDSAGRIRIVRSDGSVFVPPVRSEQTGVESIQLTADKAMIGWCSDEDVNGGNTIPTVLWIYRPGRPLVAYKSGLAIWKWYFVNNGRWAVALIGSLHWQQSPQADLVDTATGKAVLEWNPDSGDPRPRWVRTEEWEGYK